MQLNPELPSTLHIVLVPQPHARQCCIAAFVHHGAVNLELVDSLVWLGTEAHCALCLVTELREAALVLFQIAVELLCEVAIIACHPEQVTICEGPRSCL